MMEYVRKDKVLTLVRNSLPSEELSSALLYQGVKQMESEAVVPVRRGRWIPVDSYSAFGGDKSTWMAHGNPIAYYCCSECKEQAYAGEYGESLLTKFCPNCGAFLNAKEGDEKWGGMLTYHRP